MSIELEIGVYNDEWVDITSTADRDSTNFEIKVKDDVVITQLCDKTGIWPFKTKNFYVKATSLSPYSVTKDLTSYVIDRKKTCPSRRSQREY